MAGTGGLLPGKQSVKPDRVSACRSDSEVSTCNRGWRPEEESGRRWRQASHTVQTRTPTRTPSWLCSQGRGGRGGSAGAGRRAGDWTSKTTSAYALPLTPLPREFGRRPEINLRWRWLRKPCWNLETVRLRESPFWVMARMPSKCVIHVKDISIPERREGKAPSCSRQVPESSGRTTTILKSGKFFFFQESLLNRSFQEKRGIRGSVIPNWIPVKKLA